MTFLNSTKTPEQWYFAWENLQWVFFLWFWLLLFIHCCFCVAVCCSSFIAFRRHPSLFREISPGFYTHFPFYTFSPAHRRVIRDIFILTFPGSSFTVSKYNHELLVVKNLVYLLLTRFEFFSLVQSICKDYKNHFEQDLYCLQTLRWNCTSELFFRKIAYLIRLLKSSHPVRNKNNQYLMGKRCFWASSIFLIRKRSTIFEFAPLCRQLNSASSSTISFLIFWDYSMF